MAESANEKVGSSDREVQGSAATPGVGRRELKGDCELPSCGEEVGCMLNCIDVDETHFTRRKFLLGPANSMSDCIK